MSEHRDDQHAAAPAPPVSCARERAPRARLFRQAIDAAGSSERELAEALDCHASEVHRWSERDTLPLHVHARLAVVAPAVYDALRELLDRARRPSVELEPQRGVLAVGRSYGRLSDVVLESTADGVVDDKEAKAIERAKAALAADLRRVGSGRRRTGT